MEKDLRNNEGTKHQFSADRPITSRTEDRLGRADFANSIASSITDWTDQESLVIALYGAWGSGKSSIKNMVLESLRSAKSDPAPTILEFNPWQWPGQDRLAEAFFQEIGLVLGRTDTGKTAKKRAAKWRVYAATWKAGSFLASGVRKLVMILLGIVAVTGLTNSLPEGHWLKGGSTTIGLIALVFLVLEQFYGWIGSLSEKVASIFEVTSQTEALSRAEQKEELSALLRKLQNPVLVVMDDIDRLTADEIRLLFQLVKANADFPNVVYLLLFQRDIVERSLDSPPAISGRELLKKIVQVGFDIPRIEPARLEKVLFTGLDELLAIAALGATSGETDDLHRERARPAHDLAFAHVQIKRSRERDRVHTVVVVEALVLESDERRLEFFGSTRHRGKSPLRVACDTGAQERAVASHENMRGGDVEQRPRKTRPKCRGRHERGRHRERERSSPAGRHGLPPTTSTQSPSVRA